MNTKMRNTAVIVTALAVLMLVAGCREAPGPGPGEEADFRGTWTAVDTAEVFGRTLVTTIQIDIGDTEVGLTATTSEGETVVHRVTATGTYTLTETAVTFSYTGGQQSTDNGDGSFRVDTLVDLGEADLAELGADFGGEQTYSLAENTFVFAPETTTELEFTRQPE